MKLLQGWTVAGSLVFYAFFGYQNAVVFAISILWNINVINVMRINKVKAAKNVDKDAEKRPGSGKVWLFAGILVNVALLLFFKFSGTFFPVAISFYTFNQISYLVDYYRGDIDEFRPLEYLTYIMFFPKLLQGPLMGYGDFVKELKNSAKAKFDYETILRALLLISLGMFKKVVLADTIGTAVNYGYENLALLGSLEAILTAVFYSFQLYFDFSGYCDVAAGICMMMGFDLCLNFDSPYKAVNIIDFWKRWHITLTKFFTKYVYIPLGGNRKGEVRTYVNFMIIFLLSGLWHGSGWTFIVWGAMHGILYVITRLVQKKIPPKDENIFIRGIKVILTFAYVTAAWVFFRAETLSDAILLFTRMFTGGKKPIAISMAASFQLDELWYIIKVTPIMKLSFAWDICLWMFLIGSAVVIFFGKNAITYAKECKISLKTTLLTILLLAWTIVSFAGVSTFLYMNF
ncbi:D-alanyl-lipoteichoic acid acyltransferase DltB, MBOAT superfamily [Butyrivibrio sp. INlla18]|uniref:MBOAT family O-acyltransferase n=1 Tax=Butyrivibrio sp. INlla18 TaxID=1520806 RepID=UPI000891EF8F|nr:MBOAT family O-acyltransferase [Butyrivibrio sp. INlla18]SDA69572.1 D-alanyl-lipoteichoic acid acyltransferase DltB, MBOAT superfamily [Butyrivibrio sp. INlla18]